MKINKKATIICVLTIVFSGINSLAVSNDIKNIIVISDKIVLSEPIFKEINNYVSLTIEETDSVWSETGKPMLPVFSKIYTFPFGINIIDIKVNLKTEKFILSKKIQPTPEIGNLVNEISQVSTEVFPDENVYASSELYPLKPYTIIKRSGLKDGNQVFFLKIKVTPQYSPLDDILYFPQEIEIVVKYMPPEQSLFSVDEYNMVIIVPSEFSSNIQQLIDHKNIHGIRTILKTTEEIYTEYEGRDNAEQIKYFIKDAIERWNIQYVLIVGNIDLVPIRKSAAKWPGAFNYILTDHYYADIYDGNFSFCSWDSNHNDIFGEYNFEVGMIDFVDLYADVGVGRLPCKDNKEVELCVDKIITYETQTYGQDWFDKIILMGGNTFADDFPYADPRVIEGEVVTEQIAQIMQNHGFTSIKFWASMNNYKPMSINQEITKGAGFVSYSGHGNERAIVTYHPENNRAIWYRNMYLLGLFNQNKLPILFIEACSTANLDNKLFGFKIPCFAWSIIKHPFGGAIATIGSTQLIFTMVSADGAVWGGGSLNVDFFKAYEPGLTVSQMLTNAQNDYLINNPWGDHWIDDAITPEEFILLGDPSLKIGGYPGN